MKRAYLFVLLLAAPAVAMECGEGCYEYQNICACDQKAEAAPIVKPSNEKPPRSGMVARGGAMPMSLIAQDAKFDQDKRDADVQGKVAAGINE